MNAFRSNKKFIQYQEITPSVTVSVHYSKVNLGYYKASNNFLSEKNVT